MFEIVTYITFELRKRHGISTIVSLVETIRNMYMMTFIDQFKLDLRSRSGHDLIRGESDSHVGCQTTRLNQTSSLVPLTSL